MSVVALQELKTLVGLDASGRDTELQDTLDAAEAIIGRRVAPLVLTPGMDPDLKLAIAELTRHLWRPRRGPSARGDEQPSTYPGALPMRVTQLLEPFDPGVTFA